MKFFKLTIGILSSGVSAFIGYELFILDEKFYEKQVIFRYLAYRHHSL